MVLRLSRAAIVVAVLLAAWNLAPHGSQQASAADLFYNYYVPPGYDGGAEDELYVSPRPTPPLVGHTYITYQPLMPHEFLYRHHRKYIRCHPDGRRTKTLVMWR